MEEPVEDLIVVDTAANVDRPIHVAVRDVGLLDRAPWVRGLGKTAQVIIALRLLFQAGLIHRVLVVCPKPLVINWTRELKSWAEDIPFEVITGDTSTRRTQWFASRVPVKLVNYELLTRDDGF